MRALSVVFVAVLALVPACREIELISDVPRFEWAAEPPRRLTFNVGDDRNPTWSTAGDSIYYSAQGYPGIPLGRGILVSVPVEGGVVRAMYASLHETPLGPRYHVAPMPSPDGQRILFVDIVSEAAPAQCVTSMNDDCPGVAPLLQRARLIVRDFDEQSAEPPMFTEIELPGRASRGVPPPYNDHSYPYHRLYRDGRIAFTASWAPDNQRVVFSDGLRLYLWTPGSGDPVIIPGTDNAMHPEWGPAGEYIAFMRLQPFTSSSTFCRCDEGGRTRDVVRTVHTAGVAFVELIRPDGSAGRYIGAGEDPTWGPDGSLYVRRAGEIVRIDPDTGAATAIPGTERGAEPDVSPDGNRLVFTHLPQAGGSDVWVVDLVAQ